MRVHTEALIHPTRIIPATILMAASDRAIERERAGNILRRIPGVLIDKVAGFIPARGLDPLVFVDQVEAEGIWDRVDPLKYGRLTSYGFFPNGTVKFTLEHYENPGSMVPWFEPVHDIIMATSRTTGLVVMYSLKGRLICHMSSVAAEAMQKYKESKKSI